MLPPKFLVTISIVLFLVEQCLNSPVYTMQPAFITANIGTSGRNIRHLPCVSRRSGQSGVCMFAIDCLKSNGTHLGTCIDRFYFGSCCHIEPGHDINDNVISDSALPHDRHPPYRLSSTTSSTNFSTSTSSTTEKMISNYTSGTILEHRSTSKLPDIVTEQTVTTKKAEITKPLTTNIVTSITQSPQVSITEVANVSTTILKVSSSATKPAASSTENINKIVKSTTESYKISTFQSVDTAETTTPTTTRPKTTKPVKTTSKPTTTTKAQTKPRPRPTSKPISVTKPGLTRPTTKPTTIRVTAKPTRSTVRPSTRLPTKIPIKVTARPISKPSTKPSNATKAPVRPVTSTSIRPTTAKPIKTTIRSTTRPTTQKIITTPKLTTTTTSTTTTSTTTTSTTTTPSTTLSTTTPTTTTTTTTTIKTTPSTTTTEAVPPTRQAEISTLAPKPEIASPLISNEILMSSTKLPSSETVNGNTVTNEIEPVVKPTPEKKPDLVITTERTTSQMPAFITWAMVNNEQTTKEPMNNTEESEEWTPITPPDGWVLLPSVSTTPEPETISTSVSTTSTTLPPTFSTFSSFSSFETSSSSTQSPITLTTSSLTSSPSSLPSSMNSPSEIPPLTELLSSSTASVESEKVPETPEDEIQSTGVTEKINDTSSITMELVPLMDVNGTTEEIVQQTTSSMMSSTETMESTAPPVNMSDFTDVCGRRMFPEPRIVGGEKSSFGKWPWQISLRQWKTSTYLHKCGAALLNENWAITAAHCVDNVPPSDLLLRLGEHDLSTDAEPYIHQERRVQIVASHPQFDPRTFEYDLALLRFYEPVQFQPNIIPVCVPQNDETFVGRSAFVTGWGRLYEDGPLPSILQEVSVPVINNTVCEAMYRNAGYIEHIPNIFICAGWKHGGFDSCEGDSGGPMVIQRPDKRFLLAGIISWGIGCAEPNQPGVYTRISEFRDWINQILQF